MISSSFIKHIESMAHSPARNYVIPGLTSWLIGTPHPTQGCVRMFTMDRVHEEPIIPHTHRFDFHCIVLTGNVSNHIWLPTQPERGDKYLISDVTYEGQLGKHHQTPIKQDWFTLRRDNYKTGDEYSMKAEEFHSIYFSKGCKVLFFEGVNRLKSSQVLEPVVDGEVIPLFKTEPWMFKKDSV